MSSGLTPDQQSAIDPKKSIWVGASAGTGKTHILTGRVLKLMLAGANPEQILCLTYTKAAAKEMQARIIEVLGSWVQLNDQALSDAIENRTGTVATPSLRARARTLFVEVIDLPNGLNIQTVHAFCQSLLGQFPFEAGVSPQISVVEGRAAERLERDALGKLYERANAGDAGLRDALQVIATEAAEVSFRGLLQSLAYDPSFILNAPEAALDTLNEVNARLGLDPDLTRETYLETALSNAAIHRPVADQLCTLANSSKSTNDKKLGRKLAEVLAVPEGARFESFDLYASVFLKNDGDLPQKPLTKSIADAYPGLVDHCRDEGRRLQEVKEQAALYDIARRSYALTQVAAHWVILRNEAKAQQGLVDFGDLIERARRLLEGETSDWVRFRLDGGVDHILIDEAQDNNADQWAIIRAMASEFFAGESAKDVALTRTLFAVGDIKQSIFGFQGAVPALFPREGDRYKSQCEVASNPFGSIDMIESFRSTATVLALVDEVFLGQNAPRLGAAKVLPHQAFRKDVRGKISLWPRIEVDADADDTYEPRQETQFARTGKAELAKMIAQTISEELRTHRPLVARNRAVRPGDYLILLQRRTAGMDMIVRALKTAGVPVTGIDRVTLGAQLAVKDLMAAARVALLPQDSLTLAALLKSPLIGLTDDDLTVLASRNRGESLWASLSNMRDRSPFSEAWQWLETVMGRADFESPYAFFEAILSEDGGRERLVARLGNDADEMIDMFLDEAVLCEASEGSSLMAFLRWMDVSQNDSKVEVAGDTGRVRVMTVHGAKGLQAPIVILPDTFAADNHNRTDVKIISLAADDAATRNPSPYWFWTRDKSERVGPFAGPALERTVEETEENARLLYVALTRAE
ncbi:MAG: UvrD-helicase domain-containing protein, partial [Pseudomonadota bacterium]